MPIEYDPALPDIAVAGDPGHVTDHNIVRSALLKIQSWGDTLEERVAALEGNPTPIEPTVSIIGPGLSMDALGNTQIGGTDSGSANVYVDFFFTAAQSSTLVGWRLYWLDETQPPYGAGNGGTFTVTLETDDDGAPSGTALATQTGVHVDCEVEGYFPERTFTNPPLLTEGVKYHLVVRNTSSQPTVNWSSWNMSWNQEPGCPTDPRNPRWSDTEFGMLRKYVGGSFQKDWLETPGDSNEYTPIMDLRYGNGRHQGNGYMEVEVDGCFIDGSNQIRTRWTQAEDATVSGAYFRLAKNGTGTGNITYTLKKGATTLGTVTVAVSSIPLSDDTNADATTGDWLGGSFSGGNVTLAKGTEYTLVASGSSGSTVWSRGIQDGFRTGYNFDDETVFNGVGEMSSNGGTTWAQHSELANGHQFQWYMPVV